MSKKVLDLNVNKKMKKLLEKSVKEGTSKAASIKGKKIYGKQEHLMEIKISGLLVPLITLQQVSG